MSHDLWILGKWWRINFTLFKLYNNALLLIVIVIFFFCKSNVQYLYFGTFLNAILFCNYSLKQQALVNWFLVEVKKRRLSFVWIRPKFPLFEVGI